MKLHELKPAANATKLSKRIGRGQGSGKGGTSTKGHKGAQSRAGYSRKIGFEGGQMPIYRLLPKRGFKNINRVEYSPINLSTLQKLADKTQQKEITLELMKANGLISLKDKIKILGNGEITSKLTVTAHAFSKTAISAIENAGGQCVCLQKPLSQEVPLVAEKLVIKETQKPLSIEVPLVEKEPVIEEVQEPLSLEVPLVEEEPLAEETNEN
jgi:large subunit ribosomal protein L15